MLINSTTEYGYVYSVKLLKLVNHQGHRSLHGLAYHNPEQVFEMRRFADDRQAENAPYLGLKAIARFMSCVLPTRLRPVTTVNLAFLRDFSRISRKTPISESRS